MTDASGTFQLRRDRRKAFGAFMAGFFFLATVFGLLVLIALLVDVAVQAAPWLNVEFLTQMPSRLPERAGIWPAIVGSLWVMGLTGLIAVPLGVASAIYLEEYATEGWFLQTIQVNIANLAGVPSVIYGILGLAIFVRFVALGSSVMAGAMTLGLLVLPIIIISTQEALRGIPSGMREAAFALGATRSQVIWSHVLPSAAPGILTGVILSLSRAIGETAPLIMVGAAGMVMAPNSVLDPFTVLPIQIFNWTARPQDEFRGLAAAAIVVLMILLFAMNLSAILLRNYFEGKRAGD
ncbi:phosphate ABC transporter, permease protein PstA [Longibacter salinarum]|uniref:Phosphate transport system permease protein PstA n=1 Tax=Longibacter salinarum TaxID=1850348 RepID=A0A2A8CUN7_9BACT|nr:phosphate ABC transporter permease PstA [Longibacter salinarum]PEN12292.1 phosphate ABC transporter, permease protein PstA [Longibacter salinarum]